MEILVLGVPHKGQVGVQDEGEGTDGIELVNLGNASRSRASKIELPLAGPGLPSLPRSCDSVPFFSSHPRLLPPPNPPRRAAMPPTSELRDEERVAHLVEQAADDLDKDHASRP